MGLPDRNDDVARAGQYFEAEPSVESAPGSVRLELTEGTFRLTTDRGVFSAERVDPGTRILLRDGPAPRPTGTLVDLGCGYGPIAVTLALRCPAARVIAVDVNQRALDLCSANATALGVAVATMRPEEVPEDLTVDEIWSNPPIRIGKGALHELLLTWLSRLAPGGRAVLVVQRHLGADSLAGWLMSEGWAVERIGSRKGYRLLQVTRG